MEHSTKVGIVIGCVDCRLHDPRGEQYRQLQSLLGVNDVYVRTEAGPDGAIVGGGVCKDAIVATIQLLLPVKKPSVVAVCGHYDCAGHSVSNAEHDTDILKAVEILKAETNFEAIVPLVAAPDGTKVGSWQITRL